MNANELRIGNLVYQNDEIIEIKSLHPQNDDVNDEIPFHAIFGIKITQEWILKFGFEKIDHHRFKIQPSQYDWYYTYSIHDNAFRFYVEDVILCLNTIFYVHQLQNLFFSLTGSELVFRS